MNETLTSSYIDASDYPHAAHVLNAHLEQRVFHHAYLFTGPKGGGKTKVAHNFATQMFATNNWAPELLQFDFAEKNELSELRNLIQMSALTGNGSGRRVILFHNFELATTSAANMLLKTLEEPASSSIMILVANTARVLPTIMSRCVVVRFTGVINTQEQDPEVSTWLTKITEALQSGVGAQLLALVSLAELEASLLRKILTEWLQAQREFLGRRALAVNNCRVAQETLHALSTNRNTKLVLQDFFFKTKI